MKLLIISDIHGGYNNLEKVLENEKDFDKLLILGDILNGPFSKEDKLKTSNLLNKYKYKIISTKGNCDYYDNSLLEFDNENLFNMIYVDKRIFLLTHGHIYNKYNLPEIDFDILLTGHTHIPKMVKENNKYYINPGSISIPRGNSNKSYIVYENNLFILKNVDNKVISKLEIGDV